MYVKICGLTEAEHVAAAVVAGADAIGLVLVESPRRVSVARARELGRGVTIDRVAVFRALDADAVAMALAAGCTHLQAHGSVDAFRALPPTLRPLPVVHDGEHAAAEVAALRPLGVHVLVDGVTPGQGELTSHARIAPIARDHAVVLAGGLSPTNVADAIRAVRPAGVDVSSGVERTRGEKDVALIHAFVAAARRASPISEVPRC